MNRFCQKGYNCKYIEIWMVLVGGKSRMICQIRQTFSPPNFPAIRYSVKYIGYVRMVSYIQPGYVVRVYVYMYTVRTCYIMEQFVILIISYTNITVVCTV